MKKILNLLPLIAFALLVVVLYSFLTNDNDQLESVLVDKSVPEFTLPDLENPEIIISKSSINKFIIISQCKLINFLRNFI